jgi:hypothetical protein
MHRSRNAVSVAKACEVLHGHSGAAERLPPDYPISTFATRARMHLPSELSPSAFGRTLLFNALTQQFSIQPRLCDPPLSLDGSRGSFHDVGGFLYAQAAKEPQLHHPRLIGIARGQTAQRLVYGQHFRGDRVHHCVGTFGLERPPRCTTAAFERLSTSGMVDENAAHEACGDSKKLSSVLPCCASLIHELQKQFVHQRRGLQRVIRAFVT